MNSRKSQSFSQTMTQVIEKGKQSLYLVLKKKPLPEEIYDNLKNEAEERFIKFVQQKKPLLEQMKPENPELFFECFLIKAMIHILRQMLKERKIALSEKDLSTFDTIFNNDKPMNRNNKKPEKKSNENTNENGNYFNI
jgi:hypothetical protein